jgi:hypothetical protein
LLAAGPSIFIASSYVTVTYLVRLLGVSLTYLAGLGEYKMCLNSFKKMISDFIKVGDGANRVGYNRDTITKSV